MFAAINAATALRHSIDSASAARERMQEGMSRLDVEETDLGVESERLAADRMAAEQGVSGVQHRARGHRVERASLEAALAAARAEHATLAQELRTREHDLAGLSGRLRSLEELEAARAGFTEAARVLLAQANGHVEQRGAVADYLEVDRRYERAVEALLGDLLQHVVVPTHEHAAAGVQLLREQQAGRCGFVVLGQMPTAPAGPTPQGVVAVADLVRVSGPDADLLRAVVARGYVAESWDAAVSTARATGLDVATLDGELARGGHVVVGGGRQDARGILATKGEIKEVRARVDAEREALADLALARGGGRGDGRADTAGDRRGHRAAASAREGDGRLRRAAGPRARGRGAPGPQGRDADGRAPPGRGRDRPARRAAGGGAAGDCRHRIPPGRRRRAVHRRPSSG